MYPDNECYATFDDAILAQALSPEWWGGVWCTTLTPVAVWFIAIYAAPPVVATISKAVISSLC